MAKFHFYNDGVKTIRVYDEASIPGGFVKGRLNQKPAWNKGLTTETDSRVKLNSIKCHNTRKQLGYTPWNKGLTKETDERVFINYEKMKQSMLEKYGVDNPFKLPHEVWNKGLTKNTNSSVAKISQSNKGKVPWNKGKHIKGTPHSEETKKRLSEIHSSPEMKSRKAKAIVKNGTNHSSKLEKLLLELLINKFGENDVLSPYFDVERYPFNCDFYIKSKDLFIELNGFFTHQDEPYDENNSKHQKLVEQLKSDDSKWAKSILYTWTILDVKKRTIAKENNLNFLEIYPYEQSRKPREFLETLVNNL